MWNATSNASNLQPAPAMHKAATGGGRQFGVDLTKNQNRVHQQRAAIKPQNAASGSAAQRSVPQLRHEDIDAMDLMDPQCVAEYSHDIHQNFRKAEKLHMPPANYMEAQKSINVKMRAILIDWLIEVHLKFKLMPETLYLTINLIDRYLARKSCERRKLQLVGVTCMLLASKYEEIYFPEVQDFEYITDRAYSRAGILRMEGVVLNALKFDLTVATPLVFLKRFLKAAKADARVTYTAHFFTERMLQEYSMIRYPASVIAASAVHMALRVCHRPAWTPTLQHYSSYTEQDLESCIRKMTRIILAAPKSSQQAVRKKYSSQKYGKVSLGSFRELMVPEAPY